jgi:predicted phosphoadenosine phosphosulfate sulfurtransferase
MTSKANASLSQTHTQTQVKHVYIKFFYDTPSFMDFIYTLIQQSSDIFKSIHKCCSPVGIQTAVQLVTKRFCIW